MATARGGFWPTNTNDLDALLIVENAVDDLSALLLLVPTLPPDTLLASTAGVAATLPRWLQAFHAPLLYPTLFRLTDPRLFLPE